MSRIAIATVSLLACMSIISVQAAASSSAKEQITVVLLGATGNLAKKYLFGSLAVLNEKRTAGQPQLRVYPASSSAPNKAVAKVDAAIGQLPVCSSSHPMNSACDRFRSIVMPYVQLRNAEHYGQLSSTIDKQLRTDDVTEVGRIFYLSVPPEFYSDIALNIHENARPVSPAWLRVVFEKPFGSDTFTAMNLADTLAESLKEQEIYRVDHYLGKAGVQAIQQFRQDNPEYESMFNAQHVQRLEVAMLETETCEGRTLFYDEYGVIRDVFQNHLTEIVALLAEELSTDTRHELDSSEEGYVAGDVEQSKSARLALLGAIRPPVLKDTMLAQYDTYLAHCKADRLEQGSTDVSEFDTKVPTYAAVTTDFHPEFERWSGVDVVMWGGKAQSTREAFAKVVFKEKVPGKEPTLTFLIQGEGNAPARIHASADLPPFKAPSGWTQIDGRTAELKDAPNAYQVLLEEVLKGDSRKFVATPELIALWEVWTPLLEEASHNAEPVVIYSVGTKPGHDDTHMHQEL